MGPAPGTSLPSGFSLLDLVAKEAGVVPVKHTFIHFDETPEESEISPNTLRRLKTDPGCSGRAFPEAIAPAASAETDSEPLTPVAEDIPKGSASPTSSESGSRDDDLSLRRHREEWEVDAKKLDSKDCRITHTCKIRLSIDPDGQDAMSDEEAGGLRTEFVIWMQAEVQKKRRGCANFSASKGKGHIYVKCNEEKDMDLALSVEVGTGCPSAPSLPPFRVHHNFAQTSVLVLPTLWDFRSAVDPNTGKLTMAFEVMPCPTSLGVPLSPLTSPRMADSSLCTTEQWWATAPSKDAGLEVGEVAWGGGAWVTCWSQGQWPSLQLPEHAAMPPWWIGESPYGNGAVYAEAPAPVGGS
jgi:hypothetical protein